MYQIDHTPLQWRHNERVGVSNHQPTIAYSTVYSGADERKHQSPASLAFVWGIHRWPVNYPHKGPVTRKMFPFDDVIMCRVNSISAYIQSFKYWCRDIPGKSGPYNDCGCHGSLLRKAISSHVIDCNIGISLSSMMKNLIYCIVHLRNDRKWLIGWFIFFIY